MSCRAQLLKVLFNEAFTLEEVEETIKHFRHELAQDSDIYGELLLDYLYIRLLEVKHLNALSAYIEWLKSFSSSEIEQQIEDIKTKEIVLKAMHGSIGREEKIYLRRKRDSLKEHLHIQFDREVALNYALLEAVDGLEVLQLEQAIQSAPRPQNTTPKDAPKLSIHKLTNTVHPIRITGRMSEQDRRNILMQTNTPTMTIEQYGERMKALMDQQPTLTVNEDSQESSDTEEQRRLKEKKEDIVTGDGNRAGRR